MAGVRIGSGSAILTHSRPAWWASKCCGQLKKGVKKFGDFREKPYLCTQQTLNDMRQTEQHLETLTFQKGDAVATVVTNGDVVRSYTASGTNKHRTLSAAIAHLECQGYRINMQHEVII